VKLNRNPHYLYSELDAANRSVIAKTFMEQRSRLNGVVAAADNNLLKRFYNIDHNTYLEGEIPSKYKELMGLSVSAALRCDDCIIYHIIQSWRLGANRLEVEETLNVALVVGGSIVIPHLRRAYDLMAQLYSGA